MNQHLQGILSFLHQNNNLSAEEKNSIIKSLKDADKEFTITEFKLNRTEKVKKTTAVLLEETIDELEKKRKDVEAQNKELEIQNALERVRAVALGMKEPADMLEICRTISHQLELLHVKEIRNVQTAIFYEGKGTYMNYQYYAKHDKTFITDTIFTDHKMPQQFAAQMMKGKDEFFTNHISKEELPDWIAYQKTTNVFIDDYLNTATSLNYYWYSLGAVALGISTYQPLKEEDINLFKRFLKVFELSYTRYLDIEQAIAQAREAQIEAALERVRSKTMAMHQSSELLGVISLLADQFQLLGFKIHSANFNTSYREKDWNLWLYNPGVPMFPGKIYVPYFDHPFFNRTLESIARGDDFTSFVFTKEEKNGFLDHLYSNTIARNTSEERRKFSYGAPGFAWSTVYLKNTALTIANYDAEPYTEEQNTIIRRFGKVFEQTYTRFLDLQKAEAQAREAQIELGLERVRARAMAMQTSEELNALIGIVFTELTKLDLVLTRCVIIIYDAETKGAQWWMANSEAPSAPMNFFVKYANLPFFNTYIQGWEERDLKWQYILEDENKIVTDNFLFNETELKTLPGFVIEGMKAPHKVYLNASFNNFGNLTLATLEPLSEEHFNILLRFAKVFDLTYTRFNDLKQAEAQARESQIQLALERVRARTMAMQKSDELADTAALLFRQFKNLGYEPDRITIGIMQEEKQTLELWGTNGETDEQRQFYELPFNEPHVLSKCVKAWKEQKKSLVLHLSGQPLKEYAEFWKSLNTVQDARSKVSQVVFNFAFFSKGYLGFISFEHVPLQTIELLERFAGVFDLTYTRFNDLKQAEAQAREATIETALEKVRSRSMGMQKSEELQEVIKIVYEQFVQLKINVEHAGFIIDYKEKDDLHIWLADQHLAPSEVTIPWFDSTPNNSIKEAKEKGQDFFKYLLNFEEKNKFYQDLFKFVPGVPEETLEYYFNCSGLAGSGVLLDNIGLYIENFSGIPYSDEENKILMRFGKVFQQTYTRFLDLQKAEAQARESQVQLALERVRARTMAMQKSDELKSAATLLFQQAKTLGVPAYSCGYNIWEENESVFTSWMSTQEGNDINAVFNIPLTEDVNFIRFAESRKKGEPFFVLELRGERMQEHYRYLKNIPEFKEYFDYAVSAGFALPETQIHHIANFSHGNLLFITLKPCPEFHDVFKRFAAVFDQTYTRSLDLQKAEEQARESQIQLALERARAQSMMMQHSTELDDTLRVFHEQILQLNIPSAFSFLWLPDEEKERHIFWAAWAENNSFKSKAINYPLNRNEPATAQCLVDWKGNEPVVAYHVPPAGVKNYFAAWSELIAGVEQLKPEYFSDGLYYVEAFMKYGCFGVMVKNTLSEDEKKILERFAIEFERAYTRFLDLQKAEAQTRESQIQLALERVRARTMAMHNSEDVTSATETMFDELKKLGINNIRGGITNIHPKKTMDVFGITNMVDGKTMKGFTFFDMNEHPIWQRLFESWNNKDEVFVDYLAGQEKEDYINVINSHQNYLPQSIVEFPDTHFQSYRFDQGAIWTYSLQPHSESDKEIMKRFASGFALTFRRYQDLQKAEAQAREAQIEAALERVRARTMAMHKSDELIETAELLFDQLKQLGAELQGVAFAICDKNNVMVEKWTSIGVFSHPYNIEPGEQRMYEAWKNGEEFYEEVYEGERQKKYYEAFMQIPAFKQGLQKFIDSGYPLPTWQKNHAVIFKYGYLLFITTKPFKETGIFLRFGKVFEQTYTRFLDLQKAEAQTREAKIEAALEKIRSGSLAMHKSDELNDVVSVLFEKLKELQIPVTSAGISIYIEGSKDLNVYVCGQNENGLIISNYRLPYFNHAIANDLYDVREKGLDFFVGNYSIKDKNSFYEYVFKHSALKHLPVEIKQQIFQSKSYTISAAPAKHSMITINDFEGKVLSENEIDIVKRFTKVFEQAYIRFLDLQKAEANAREAQIEASLERVRAKAMAMQNSNDLSVAASIVFTELRKLGINPIRCGVGLLNKEDLRAQLYAATSSPDGDSLSLIGWAKMSGHPVLKQIYDAWLIHEDIFPELSGEQLKLYYEELLKGLSVKIPNWQSGEKQYGHFFSFSIGCLYAWSETPFSDSQIKILKRFATIVDLTFRRYLELQTSEANAREAIKQAALDRIRADIASMRTVNDLNRITPLIWNELTILGVPFIRCGVFIMDDEQQLIHTFLSTPDGKAIAAFHITYNTPGNIKHVISHWHDKKNYIDHWNEDAFTIFAKTLVEQGALTSSKQYLETIPHGGFYLHFLPFLQGMLYVGNTAQLSEDEINLIQSIADAFSTAYARYEDFNKLEAAKKQVDFTLNELRATQKQLVQSEKMASLGELTAGIAHEIQNPLNFVNNFSEVSKELIDEMRTALEKGDKEEAEQIANDIILNLEKINHHGKRADAIVKGMLQHSRQSSGKKEPTDINALCDEYLRLSFHGLRAKDKSFNAEIKTDFDESIGKINVVPQDIGRVLLNLFNNAFYTMNEKAKLQTASYTPQVIVETKKLNDKVEIIISDNGNGIPQNIIDKIFQPFFTTKPTGQGTGLGLSLAYDIITKEHNGTIKVESKEGEGSEFIIQLPI